MLVKPESYCFLKAGTILQKTPKGATLHIPGLRDAGDAPWRKTLKRAVNPDGARVLELCLGAADAGRLISEFNTRYPANRLTPEGGLEFLSAAAKAGMIAVSDTPVSPAGLRICGSFDCFYPEHTTVELTNRCDLVCEHCYRASSPDKDLYIDHAVLMNYLREFHAHGGTIVELTGGEPTLHPDFLKTAAWCHGHMNTFGLLTNAYGIGERQADALAPYKDNMVMAVSLDSCRPEFHSRFRGRPDAFGRTTRAIKLLAERGFLVRAGMSVTLENFFDIEGTIRLARGLGASKFTFSFVYDVGRAGESTLSRIKKLPDSARYFDYYNRMLEEHKDFLVTISEARRKSLKKGNCGLVHRTVTLSPGGLLRPCVMFDKSLTLGDINRQSFEEIFSAGIGNRFAGLSAPKPETCGSCEDLGYCSNCVLRGLKTAVEKGGCRWLDGARAAEFAGRMNLRGKNCIISTEPDVD